MSISGATDSANLLAQVEAIHTGVWFTDLANTSALILEALPDLNWVGFYLLHEGKLWLGPFQGKAACTFIDLGRGVCGRAALEKKTYVVPNVHEFSDHIACDANSASEVVVPLMFEGRLLGVLDVDSPKLDRFRAEDVKLLEQIALLISSVLKNAISLS